MTRKNLELLALTTGAIIYVASAVADISSPRTETKHYSIPYNCVKATLGMLMSLPIIRRANREYNES